jgi:hypothetical protein
MWNILKASKKLLKLKHNLVSRLDYKRARVYNFHNNSLIFIVKVSYLNRNETV